MRDRLLLLILLPLTITTVFAGDSPITAQQSFIVQVVPKIEVATSTASGQDKLAIKSNVRLLLQLDSEPGPSVSKTQPTQAVRTHWSTTTRPMTTTTVVLSDVVDPGTGFLTLTIVPLDQAAFFRAYPERRTAGRKL